MNLADVIEGLVEERGLPREEVVAAVCEGFLAAYSKKFPEIDFAVSFNKKLSAPEVFACKKVVTKVTDEASEVTVRKARSINAKAKVGSVVEVPFAETIGRIEVLAAKQIITGKIRELEQRAVAEEFKDKKGTIVSCMAHKRERAGLVVKMSDVMALLPTANSIPGEVIRIGLPIRALLKEVLVSPRSGYQIILDRASADFVRRLLELEIPEVFERLVEIKKIVRIAGYKTKVAVFSNSKEIDPVGTCVGVGGSRIKPILKELSGEKIDLIEWTTSLERLVKDALKPAEIDKVEITDDGSAMVWLAQDQRSLAIGKLGRNISLASQLTGIEVTLQEIAPIPAEVTFITDGDEEGFGVKEEEKDDVVAVEGVEPQAAEVSEVQKEGGEVAVQEGEQEEHEEEDASEETS